ncbi:MAG: glycosyltransferase family 1 protein [Eubacteriales bacterium]|nr:glycosyltransferase family 1 protein [Eubacteriales bacterium]
MININADISSANSFGSGISVFENEIITRLAQNPNFSIVGCTNYNRKNRKDDYARFNFKLQYSIIPHRVVYNHRMPFSYEMMMGQADVNLFCTYSLPKVIYKAPVISTIHDIILQKANSEKPEIIRAYDDKVRYAISVSDHIITVSNATKQDLIEYYNLRPEDITVVYNGVDYGRFNQMITDDELNAVRSKYGLPDKFFVYFGGVRKHKNLERLITAYSLLSAKIREEYKLVITKQDKGLIELAKKLGIEETVHFTTFIDEEDKVAIYQLAFASIFISLYEGFGIPIIESMGACTPVITSNTSSMPEAAGDAAILVDPYSEAEISAAMLQLIEDKGLYEKLVVKGTANAKRFSWDESAKTVEAVIHRITNK